MCPVGTVVTEEAADLEPFAVMTNILVTEFSESNENI